MNLERQLKLQAHLDGELPPGEAREVADLLAQDAEARALLAELKNTRAALQGFETDIKLPESREFYWSKIEREIRRLEKEETSPAPVPVLAWLRRLLIPAAALSAIVLAVVLIRQQLGSETLVRGPETFTAFADPSAFTYRDYASGTTLVWVSYPAEMEFAEFFPADTLD